MKPSSKPTREGKRAEGALKKAVADVIAEHKRLGVPIAVMKNGKAVYVQLDDKVSTARESKTAYRPKR